MSITSEKIAAQTAAFDLRPTQPWHRHLVGPGELERALQAVDELATLKTTDPVKEAAHWRLVASYLASCHAATLEGLPKSASKSERRRLTQICRKAALFLKKQESPPYHYTSTDDEKVAHEIQRCETAADKYGLS